MQFLVANQTVQMTADGDILCFVGMHGVWHHWHDVTSNT